MLQLVRNATVFAPEPLGRRDLLIADRRIAAIAEQLPRLPADIPHTELDLGGLSLCPGLIDAHIHYPQTQVIGSYGAQLLEWDQRGPGIQRCPAPHAQLVLEVRAHHAGERAFVGDRERGVAESATCKNRRPCRSTSRSTTERPTAMTASSLLARRRSVSGPRRTAAPAS